MNAYKTLFIKLSLICAVAAVAAGCASAPQRPPAPPPSLDRAVVVSAPPEKEWEMTLTPKDDDVAPKRNDPSASVRPMNKAAQGKIQ